MTLESLEGPLSWSGTWRDRILGGMLGLAVGDALGLPWEFRRGDEIEWEFTGDMVGGGTWGMPPGTWSDDTAQALALIDTLVSEGPDPRAFLERLLEWYRLGKYTVDGMVFDIGFTTRRALEAFESGVPPERAGARVPSCGGLMRCFPIPVYTLCDRLETALDVAHRMCAATHAHPVAMMACGLYTIIVRGVFAGLSLRDAVAAAGEAVDKIYSSGEWAGYARRFRYLESVERLASERPEEAECEASKMLRAALWSVLSTDSFEEALVNAVKLGGDTDTVAAIAGSIAGAYYGVNAIPSRWLSKLRGRSLVEEAAHRLASTLKARCGERHY